MKYNVVFLRPNLAVRALIFTILSVTTGASFAELEEGESGVIASAELLFANDSNVQKNAFGVEDSYFGLAPEIEYRNFIGKHELTLGYEGEYRQFSDLDNLNFNNHLVNAGVSLDHSLRFKSEFTATFEDAREDPAQVNSGLAQLSEFTKFERTMLSADVIYGTEDSKGQFVNSFELGSVEYTNNEQSFRNLSSLGAIVQFFYRLAPNTRAVIEVSSFDFEYSEVPTLFDQSSNQTSTMLGIEWRASEQLFTTILLGHQKKKFNDEMFGNIEGLTYALNLNWFPTIATDLTVVAFKTASESAIRGFGGTLNTSLNIALEHRISEKNSIYSNYIYAKNEFNIRSDVNNSFQFGIQYRAKNWMDLKLEYVFEERDSGFESFNFNSNVVRLSFISTFN